MSEKPHCVLGCARCMILRKRFAALLRIREINQILRILISEIMESSTHIQGSYYRRTSYCQTAMKVQEIASSSCTNQVGRCI